MQWVLTIWFVLTGLSTLYVAWNAFTRNPEMRVMRWGWVLVTLYTGPVGMAVYILSCQEPSPGSHEQFILPLWKQGVGSTIHCLAGDATGVILAAALTSALGLPMWLDSLVEYVFGFLVGLLFFQALFMKDMFGGSYAEAVRRSFIPEWLSMNCVMADMVPVMVILMSRDAASMEAASPRFWGIMSLATLVGAVASYPVNVWLVSAGLKHGMGTERALGQGGQKVGGNAATTSPADPPGHSQHSAGVLPHAIQAAPSGTSVPSHPSNAGAAAVTPSQLFAVTTLTLVSLGSGVLISALAGNPTMSRASMHGNETTGKPSPLDRSPGSEGPMKM